MQANLYSLVSSDQIQMWKYSAFLISIHMAKVNGSQALVLRMDG
jgi:hypothetical protein